MKPQQLCARYTTATRSFHLLGVFYPGQRIEMIAKERRQSDSLDLRSAIARIMRRHKLHPAARLMVLRMTGYESSIRNVTSEWLAVDRALGGEQWSNATTKFRARLLDEKDRNTDTLTQPAV